MKSEAYFRQLDRESGRALDRQAVKPGAQESCHERTSAEWSAAGVFGQLTECRRFGIPPKLLSWRQPCAWKGCLKLPPKGGDPKALYMLQHDRECGHEFV
jgi:hypothetical protein